MTNNVTLFVVKYNCQYAYFACETDNESLFLYKIQRHGYKTPEFLYSLKIADLERINKKIETKIELAKILIKFKNNENKPYLSYSIPQDHKKKPILIVWFDKSKFENHAFCDNITNCEHCAHFCKFTGCKECGTDEIDDYHYGTWLTFYKKNNIIKVI